MHVLPLRCSQLHVLGRVGGNWMCCSFCGWSSSGARAVKLTVFKMLNSYFFSLAAIVSPGPALSHLDSMCFVIHWAEADLSRVHLLCSCTEFAVHGPREAPAMPEQKYPIFCRISYKYRNKGKTGLRWTLRWENLIWPYKSKVLNETGRMKKGLQNYIL